MQEFRKFRGRDSNPSIRTQEPVGKGYEDHRQERLVPDGNGGVKRQTTCYLKRTVNANGQPEIGLYN